MHGDGCPCVQCATPGFGGPGPVTSGFTFEWPETWTLGDLSALGLVLLASITVYREFFGKKGR